jgi:hypothetical protein
MPANIVRNVRSMPRNSPLMSSMRSSVNSAPVRASAPSGTIGAMRSTSSSCDTPSSAFTSTLLMRSSPPVT